jgi:heme oxygenase
MTATATHSPGILARLKAETRAEHDAIERILDLTRDGLTLAEYRGWLERLYGFYRPLEARLPDVPGLDLGARRKTPLLQADLAALGVDDPAKLPECTELPPLRTADERFGCAYVLEGATLGGQVISRHLRRTLTVTPERGGRFFHGYGPRTGEMWQAFRAAAAAFVRTTEAQDRSVAAALATFRTLRRWCEEGRTP